MIDAINSSLYPTFIYPYLGQMPNLMVEDIFCCKTLSSIPPDKSKSYFYNFIRYGYHIFLKTKKLTRWPNNWIMEFFPG